jgi:FMN reductase [NAD(P)H]
MGDAAKEMRETLAHRFGGPVAEIPVGQGPATLPQTSPRNWPETWSQMARRGSCRRFAPRLVAPELVETLCGLALSAPTKSDLQQRDIVIVDEPATRARIDQLLSTGPLAQDWIPSAPALLVFCGNNRRQRQLHEWRGKPFANDHLDAFFNAAVDAGIALSAFVIAAEAAGLGCACISAIRNHAAEVSGLLGLPAHVFPIAGLGLGWPTRETYVSLRLPLSATVHRNRFSEAGIKDTVDAYDRRRAAVQPIRAQRATAEFGTASFYGWSEDKVRQYARPERADWGAFVRGKGFRLD